jgi:hypothetical protein
LSAVQVGGLLFVIAIGLPHVGDVDLFSGPGAAGVLSAAALVFFAFIGFDEVITLAEETRDPTRTVPRALLLALGVSTALYVAVAVAAVSVLGAGALAASPRPLADVMAHVLGNKGATVVAAIAILTTTNTTLLALTAASRVAYGMAKAGAIPPALASVSLDGRSDLGDDSLPNSRCRSRIEDGVVPSATVKTNSKLKPSRRRQRSWDLKSHDPRRPAGHRRVCGERSKPMMKTLSEAIESFVRRGFTEHFGVRGDQLRGFESGKTFGANEVMEFPGFSGDSVGAACEPLRIALDSAPPR